MGAPPVTNVLEKARRVLAKKSVAVLAAILALVIAAAVFIGPRLVAEPAV
jgi:cell division protease FtsH